MYADILILSVLMEGSCHGYEIRHSAGRMLGGSCLLNNNQLYPLLRRFEREGIVTSVTQAQAGRPDRRVYTLTPKGKERLRLRVGDLNSNLAQDDREFLVRVQYFHLIDVPTRRGILETRRQVLHQRLERNSERLGRAEMKKYPYVLRVSEFAKARTGIELKWIEKMLKEES